MSSTKSPLRARPCRLAAMFAVNCPACAAKYAPELVEIYSVHYWVPDPRERAALARNHAVFDDVRLELPHHTGQR